MKVSHVLKSYAALLLFILLAFFIDAAMKFARADEFDAARSIYISQSVQTANYGPIIVPLRQRRLRRGVANSGVSSPLDIRTPTQLVATAKRYLGARNFTGLRGPWCAAALRQWLQASGHSVAGTDNRAISFARYGRATGPHIGAIAVQRHHVGIVIGMTARGPILLSGNHSRRVGVGVYSARRVVAYREAV